MASSAHLLRDCWASMHCVKSSLPARAFRQRPLSKEEEKRLIRSVQPVSRLSMSITMTPMPLHHIVLSSSRSPTDRFFFPRYAVPGKQGRTSGHIGREADHANLVVRTSGLLAPFIGSPHRPGKGGLGEG